MIKNKIIAFGFVALMFGTSVKAAETKDVSAVRKGLSKVFHIAALASIYPTHYFFWTLNGATKGNTFFKKSTIDQAKIGLAFTIPCFLEVISDILAKTNVVEIAYNSAKILAVQSSLLLVESGKVTEYAKKFAELGNKETPGLKPAAKK